MKRTSSSSAPSPSSPFLAAAPAVPSSVAAFFFLDLVLPDADAEVSLVDAKVGVVGALTEFGFPGVLPDTDADVEVAVGVDDGVALGVAADDAVCGVPHQGSMTVSMLM